MIVIVIIAILAIIVVPRVYNASLKARESSVRNDLHSMRYLIDIFHHDVGGYPTSLDQLVLPKDQASTLPAQDASGDHMNPAGYDGPYILNRLPSNPFSSDGSWGYDPAKGWVYCNSDDISSDGTSYTAW